MVVRISESEFASWGAKGVKGLPVKTATIRRISDKRRDARKSRSRSRRSTAWREVWPVLAGFGTVAALGFIASRGSNGLNGLGTSPAQAQNAQIGGAIGSAVSAITGIPGIGQIGSLIGSLFGPSVHTDPQGIPQDTVQGIFEETAQLMFASINQARAQLHLPLISFPTLPAPGGAAMASWSTGIMAEVLYDPGLNSSSQDRLAQLREDGTMDAAIAAMQSIMKGLQLWQAGLSAPPPQAHIPPPPPKPPVQSYGTVTGTAAPPAPGSYQATQAQGQAATPSASIETWLQANPILAVGGAVVLVLLFTRTGSAS